MREREGSLELTVALVQPSKDWKSNEWLIRTEKEKLCENPKQNNKFWKKKREHLRRLELAIKDKKDCVSYLKIETNNHIINNSVNYLTTKIGING